MLAYLASDQRTGAPDNRPPCRLPAKQGDGEVRPYGAALVEAAATASRGGRRWTLIGG